MRAFGLGLQPRFDGSDAFARLDGSRTGDGAQDRATAGQLAGARDGHGGWDVRWEAEVILPRDLRCWAGLDAVIREKLGVMGYAG